jgi:hypothetical protein
MDVKEEDILAWLGESPCILLVDEINLLPQLSKADDLTGKAFANFLKSNFLIRRQRYFIFSSHIASTSRQLSLFMDSESTRGVDVVQLPLISNLKIVRKVFNIPDFSVQESIDLALVPAMVYLSKVRHLELSHKRNFAIECCLNEGLVSNKSVVDLIQSFITGADSLVMQPLLRLMDTAPPLHKNIGMVVVRWIPYHMIDVLEQFRLRATIRDDLKDFLFEIVKLFRKFKECKELSGESWENLFVFLLLIRAQTCLFDDIILPLNYMDYKDCSVSYNNLYFSDRISLRSCKNIDDLVAGMTLPEQLPHIAIYYPLHSSFETVDVVVAAYNKRGERELYAYQLKEGEGMPKKSTKPSDLCVGSFIIRGLPIKSSKVNDGWIIPNEAQIKKFFGESGSHWTPQEWKKLLE